MLAIILKVFFCFDIFAFLCAGIWCCASSARRPPRARGRVRPTRTWGSAALRRAEGRGCGSARLASSRRAGWQVGRARWQQRLATGRPFGRLCVVQVRSRNSGVQSPCRNPGSLALETERGVSGEQPWFRAISCSLEAVSCPLSGSPRSWHLGCWRGLRVLLPRQEIPKGSSPSPPSRPRV